MAVAERSRTREVRVEPLDSREHVNRFLAGVRLNAPAKFFHTWDWGEFNRAIGYRVHRFAVRDCGSTIGATLMVEMKDRFGPYMYVPRGPAVDYSDRDQAECVLRAVIEQGRRLNPRAVCVRVDPALQNGSRETAVFQQLGFKPAGRFLQVERAWMCDLQATHERQLEWQKAHGMRSNLPRYLSRAEKEGVVVRHSDSPEDLEIFIEMLAHLDHRKNGIGAYPYDFYRRQLAALASSGLERIFIAEHNGHPLAAALVAVYGDEASYLWGASYDCERRLRAPHYMHFKIMRYAYERGCRRYNFWGVVSNKNHHPGYKGYGYSEFKRSFGGYVEHYQRAQDYPYRQIPYRLMNLNDRRRLRAFQLS
jgi:peptidoglycan pentaglycine glycine transferase (the first glycine)